MEEPVDPREGFICEALHLEPCWIIGKEFRDSLKRRLREARNLGGIIDILKNDIVKDDRYIQCFEFADNESLGAGECYIFDGLDTINVSRIEVIFSDLLSDEGLEIMVFRFIRKPYCDEVVINSGFEEDELRIHVTDMSVPFYNMWEEEQAFLNLN